MARVRFTNHLKNFFPDLGEIDIEASSVAELVTKIDGQHPGLADYLVDERGSLRKHVNIFVNEEMIEDRVRLSDTLGDNAQVYILQALSGG